MSLPAAPLPSLCLFPSPGTPARSLWLELQSHTAQCHGGQKEPHPGQQPHIHLHPLCFHWHSSHLSCKFLPWLLDTGLGTLHLQE